MKNSAQTGRANLGSDAAPEGMPWIQDLYPYQRRAHDVALEAVVEHGDNILISAPTGSGKTHIETALIATLLSLGYTVGLISSRNEIVEQTDEQAKGLHPGMKGVVMSTPTKYWNDLHRGLFDMPDVLIVDEAHHALADTWQRYFGATTPTGRKVIIVGLTATPMRGVELETREWRTLFRRVYEATTIVRCMKEGYGGETPPLVPFYLRQDVLGTLGEAAEERDRKQDEASHRRVLEQLDYIFEVMRRLDPSRPTVVILPKARTASKLVAEFNTRRLQTPGCAMPIFEEVVHDVHPAVRNRIFARLQRNMCWAAAVNIMTEGVDIPEISRVGILRASTSPIVVVQAYGRGLRQVRPKKAKRKMHPEDAATYEQMLRDYQTWVSRWEVGPKEWVEMHTRWQEQHGTPYRAGVSGGWHHPALDAPPPPYVPPALKRDCEIVDFTRNVERFRAPLAEVCGIRLIPHQGALIPDMSYDPPPGGAMRAMADQPFMSIELEPVPGGFVTIPMGGSTLQVLVGKAVNAAVWAIRYVRDGRTAVYVLSRTEFKRKAVGIAAQDYIVRVGGRDDLALNMLSRLAGDWAQATGSQVRLSELLAYALMRQLESKESAAKKSPQMDAVRRFLQALPEPKI